MSTFYSLLFFACLGFAASSVLEYRTFGSENGSGRIAKDFYGSASNASNALDGSELIAGFYTTLFHELAKMNDSTNLALNLHDSFSFFACFAPYFKNKEKFLEILQYRARENLTFEFERSMFVSPGEIKVFVTMDVLGNLMAAQFVLHKSREQSWQWLEGRCIGLSTPHITFADPNGTLAQNATDSSRIIAEGFVMFFNEYVRRKDLSFLPYMLHDDFLFSSCTRNYNKQSILEIVRNLPTYEKLSLKVENSKWLSDNEMKIDVFLEAFHQKFSASLLLRKDWSVYNWIGGHTKYCSD